jgi:hypothetical protein
VIAMADIQARSDGLRVESSESWQTLGSGEIVVVPGKVGVLDLGVQWFRTADELEQEWQRLRRYATLIPTGDDIGYQDLSGGLRALIGVRATARWCLGKSPKSPMSARPALVTGANIRSEQNLAETIMTSRHGNWEHATGVAMWLLWVTGATDKPVYLGW